MNNENEAIGNTMNEHPKTEPLRDKIAGIIWHDRQGQNTPESVADAILATIKASVPELVWGEWHGYSLHTWNNLAALTGANSAYGRYSIGRLHRYLPSTDKKVRPFDHEYSNEWWVEAPFNKGALLGPFGHDVEAQAAAQAHHVAQKTDWMGVE